MEGEDTSGSEMEKKKKTQKTVRMQGRWGSTRKPPGHGDSN